MSLFLLQAINIINTNVNAVTIFSFFILFSFKISTFKLSIPQTTDRKPSWLTGVDSVDIAKIFDQPAEPSVIGIEL